MTRPGQRFDAFLPGAHPIDAYGAGGFRFAGMSHVGSILATPKGISAVATTDVNGLDASAVQRLFDELAATPGYVEFVVIGTGAKMARAAPGVALALGERGLRFEAMATGPAARMYNIMIGEQRRVAALLLAAP